jgi:hypothetical protein
VVGIALLEHRDPAFASDCIDPVTPLVIEDIVAVPNGGQSRNLLPLIRIQYDEPSGKPGYHE